MNYTILNFFIGLLLLIGTFACTSTEYNWYAGEMVVVDGDSEDGDYEGEVTPEPEEANGLDGDEDGDIEFEDETGESIEVGDDGGIVFPFDPLPDIDEPGEYECEGCPDINLPPRYYFFRDLGDMDEYTFDIRKMDFIRDHLGDGIWYLKQVKEEDLNKGGIEEEPINEDGAWIPTDAVGAFEVNIPLFCGIQIVKLAWPNEAGDDFYVIVVQLRTIPCD